MRRRGFDAPAAPRQWPSMRFDGGHRHVGARSPKTLQTPRFRAIVLGRRRAVRVHVIDIAALRASASAADDQRDGLPSGSGAVGW